MTTHTNRLDEIAQRQRTSRSRDLAFAILIAMLMIFQITGLRSAVAKTSRSVAAQPAATLPAPADVAAPNCTATTTPVC
jgi:hypothetical protein